MPTFNHAKLSCVLSRNGSLQISHPFFQFSGVACLVSLLGACCNSVSWNDFLCSRGYLDFHKTHSRSTGRQRRWRESCPLADFSAISAVQSALRQVLYWTLLRVQIVSKLDGCDRSLQRHLLVAHVPQWKLKHRCYFFSEIPKVCVRKRLATCH